MRLLLSFGFIALSICGSTAFAQEPPQVQFLEGHKSAARSVAYTPDGKSLISGSADGSVRVWDRATGELIRALSLHEGPILCLAVSPNGTEFATGGLDRNIQRVDVPTRHFLASLASVPNVPTKLAISKDGKLALSGDTSNIVRLWNLESNAVVRDFGGSTKPITGLAILPEAKQVLGSSADGFLRYWNLDNAQLEGAVFPTPLEAFAINSAGDLIAGAGQDGLLRLIPWPPTPPLSLPGHSDQVMEVALSADEKLIASGSLNGQVHVYQAEDGKQLHALKGHEGQVTALGMSGDGSLIATGNNTGVVKVWKNSDAALQFTIAAHKTPINSLAFHPKLKQIATAGADGRIQILTLAEAPKDPEQKTPPPEPLALESLKQINAHQGAINGIAFSPDGEFLLSAGADKTVRQWEKATGREVASYSGSSNALHALAVSADGKKLIAGGTDAKVYVWEIPPNPEAAKPAQVAPSTNYVHAAAIHSVAANDDGSIIAAGGDDRLIRLWDAATGIEREQLVGHTSTVRSIAISKSGRTVISGSSDRGLRHWKPAVLRVVLAHEGGVHDVCFSADGRQIYSAGADKFVRKWNAADLKAGRTYTGAEGPLKTLAVSQDGKTLAAGGEDSAVRIWNAENETPSASLKLPAAVTSIAIAENGRKLIVAAGENVIKNFGLETREGKLEFVLTNEFMGHTAAATHLALAADGQMLISTGADRTLKRWFAASAFPQPRGTLGHNSTVYGLAYHPDGTRLASASGDQSLRVWDLETREELFQCEGHTSQVYAVAFHPTANILASGGKNDAVRIWNGETGEEIGQHAQDDPAGINSLDYSNDGKWLLAAGNHNIWRAFPTETPKEPMETPLVGQGHNETIQSLKYNKAGNRVATVDYSGKLIIWNPANGEALFHQQLPVSTAYSLAYSPDGTELAVATKDPRVLRVVIPPYAR